MQRGDQSSKWQRTVGRTYATSAYITGYSRAIWKSDLLQTRTFCSPCFCYLRFTIQIRSLHTPSELDIEVNIEEFEVGKGSKDGRHRVGVYVDIGVIQYNRKTPNVREVVRDGLNDMTEDWLVCQLAQMNIESTNF